MSCIKMVFAVFVMLLLPTMCQAEPYFSPGNGVDLTMDSLVVYSSGVVSGRAPNYQINDSITILSGDKLTIAAGSILKFTDTSGSHELYVEGTLSAVGTQEQPIIFTSSSQIPGAWGLIGIKDKTPSQSIIDHAIIEYAVTGVANWNSDGFELKNSTIRNCLDEGIYVNHASPKLLGNVIENIDDGIEASDYGRGISVWNNSFPLIDSNTIRNNSAFGILIDGSYPTVIRNVIEANNSDATEDGVGIFVQNNSNASIENNDIVNNTRPLRFQTGSTGRINNNRFIGNTWGARFDAAIGLMISGNRFDAIETGLYFWDSHGRIESNEFLDQNFGFVAAGTSTAVLVNNSFHDNGHAVEIEDSAVPNLGNLSNADLTDNGGNIFANNVFNIFNTTSTQVVAQNNNWSTTDPIVLEQKLYGSVNYTPSNPEMNLSPTFDSLTINDDSALPSFGNGNSIAESSEVVELYVSIRNTTSADILTGLSAVLSTTSPYAKIIHADAGYNPLLRQSPGENLEPFVVLLAPNIPDGTSIPFTLQMSAIWSTEFTLQITNIDDQFAPSLRNVFVTPQVAIGDQAVILVQALDGDPDQIVTAEIRDRQATLLETLTLLDDGLSGDYLSDDTYYATTWTMPGSGPYFVSYKACDGNGNKSELLNAAWFSNQPGEYLEITDLSFDAGVVTVYYVAYRGADDLVTTGWQYSLDGTHWLDIDSAQISNNVAKPGGQSFIQWDSQSGSNNLVNASGRIYYRMSLASQTFSAQIRYPVPYAQNLRGLTFDGGSLYSCDSQSQKIYAHRMDAELSIYRQVPYQGVTCMGIEWDGTSFWTADGGQGKIHRHSNDENLTIDVSYDSVGLSPSDIAWDGANLWTSYWDQSRIYRHNSDMSPFSGYTVETTHSEETNENRPVIGLEFIANTLWAADNGQSENVYKLNSDVQSVARKYSEDGWHGGLAWDGRHLWMVDSYPDINTLTSYSLPVENRATFSFLLNCDDPDNDGICADSDLCPLGNDNLDVDKDGVADACDNCPGNSNPLQADANNNGIGDSCDTLSDSDRDSVPDNLDAAPLVVNAAINYFALHHLTQEDGNLAGEIIFSLPGAISDLGGLNAVINGPNGFSYTAQDADISNNEFYKRYTGLEEGIYTLTVSDSLGGKLSRSDNYTGLQSTPLVAVAQLEYQQHADGSYRFHWPIVNAAFSYSYRFKIADAITGQTVFADPRSQGTIADVPAGLLKNNSTGAYTWQIETSDRDTYELIFNRSKTGNQPLTANQGNVDNLLPSAAIYHRTDADSTSVVAVNLELPSGAVETPWSATVSGPGDFSYTFTQADYTAFDNSLNHHFPATDPQGPQQPGIYTFRALIGGSAHQFRATLTPAVVYSIPDSAAYQVEDLNSGSIKFSWADVNTNGLLYYRVMVINENNDYYTTPRQNRNSATVNLQTLTNTLGKGPLRWRVEVHDSNNYLSLRNRVNGAWIDLSIPAYDPEKPYMSGRINHRNSANGQQTTRYFADAPSADFNGVLSLTVSRNNGENIDLVQNGQQYRGLDYQGYTLSETDPVQNGLYRFDMTTTTGVATIFDTLTTQILLPVVDARTLHIDQFATGDQQISWAPVYHTSPLWYNLVIYSVADHNGDGFPDEVFTRYNLSAPYTEIPAGGLPEEPLFLSIQARDASTGALENNRSVSLNIGYAGVGYAYGSLVDADNDGWANNIDVDDNDPNSTYEYAVIPNTYTLTLVSIGTGSGTTTGSGSYSVDTPVAPSATAEVGSLFVGWTPSSCSGTFAMTADITCTATFTLDPTPLNITGTAPANGAQNVAYTSDILITFSEAIQPGSGTITLKTDQGQIIDSYDAATSSNLNFSGHTLTISPTDNLSYSTRYRVEFAPDSIRDLSGYGYAGSSSYDFTTVAPPSDIVDIYVGTFGRAPDEGGLQYWEGVRNSGILDLAGIASNFMLSEEAQTKFPGGVSNEQLIRLLYDNLFDRAPDTEGLNYWVDLLDRQIMSRELSIANIIGGARATTGNPNDAAVFNLRIEKSLDYLADVAAGQKSFTDELATDVVQDVRRIDVADPDLEPDL